MDLNKQRRIIKSILTGLGYCDLNGRFVDKRVTKTNHSKDYTTIKYIDKLNGSVKVVVKHHTGMIEVMFSIGVFHTSRVVNIRVGTNYTIGFQAQREFVKGTHKKTIEDWVTETLMGELKNWS